MYLPFIFKLSHMSLILLFIFFSAALSLWRNWCFRVWQDVWIYSSPDRTTLHVFAMLIHFCLLLQRLQRSSVCCVCTKSKPCELYYLWHSLYHNCFCARCIYFLGKHTVKLPSRANEPHVSCTRNVTDLSFVRFTACTKTIHVADLQCNWCFLEVHIHCQSKNLQIDAWWLQLGLLATPNMSKTFKVLLAEGW